MKRCPKCGQTKPETEFHRNKGRPDGVQVYCKPCAIKRSSDWNKAHRTKRREHQSRWRKMHPEKIREYNRENYQRHKEERNRKPHDPLARKARYLVRKAVRCGVLVKPEVCDQCKCWFPGRRIIGFWHDYGKPLEVRWLCIRCHYEATLEKRRQEECSISSRS